MLPEGMININGESVQVLQILFLTTLITLLPSLMVMMTSFAKYVITLSFLRLAMGTQQTPPNTVLVGLALFLTLLTMQPVFSQIQTQALEPYQAEQIGEEEFIDRAAVPLKRFMLDNTEPESLELYCGLAGIDTPTGEPSVELPLHIVVPAFMTTELKEAFLIGFLLYIPFILIDVVVATTLRSRGMIRLPPAMISTPFKLLLFISVNGWDLLFSSLVQSVGLGLP